MAHQLGATFHIPHGRANAILLPYIIEFNSEIDMHSKSRPVYAPSVRKNCNMARIQFMNKEMNIPLSVSALGGISEGEYMSKVEFMAEMALKDACTATNPRTPTKREVMEIYHKIWQG